MKMLIQGTGFRMVIFEEAENDSFWTDEYNKEPFDWLKGVADDLNWTMQTMDYMKDLEKMIGDGNKKDDDDDEFQLSIDNYCERFTGYKVHCAEWYEKIRHCPVKFVQAVNRDTEHPISMIIDMTAPKVPVNTIKKLNQFRKEKGLHRYVLDESGEESSS